MEHTYKATPLHPQKHENTRLRVTKSHEARRAAENALIRLISTKDKPGEDLGHAVKLVQGLAGLKEQFMEITLYGMVRDARALRARAAP